jgi:hypothetical protein
MSIFGVLNPEESPDKCEAAIKRSWGVHFEENLNLFRAAMAQHPEYVALLERFPAQLSNNSALIQRVVAAYSRRARK